ncbi:hypothetical protein [Rufibacter aurantiacus]|uniref:hypothetical protein n=1 Tax=Rufibacter aurantiacus TaxID=2817374 RepID=UPI001B30C12F|nr:hypothetical protein [Rufibacter aurantiacus]
MKTTTAGDLLILPGKSNAVICRVTGDEIIVLQELDFNFTKNQHVFGGNRWILAFCGHELDELGEPITIFKQMRPPFLYRARLDEKGNLERFPNIYLPRLELNKTLAISGDVVYMGGHLSRSSHSENYGGGEIAGFMNLLEEQPKWQRLPIPVEMNAGKSIDDILIYDKKLVLVDNIQFPKYLFEYDITNPLKPGSTKTINLPNNGTYEHIYRGCINKDWMALYSSGVGRRGVCNYVTVQRLPSYKQVLTVHLLHDVEHDLEGWNEGKPFDLKEELTKARSKVRISDFALAGNVLLVACGHHGIISYSLQELWEEYSPVQPQRFDNAISEKEDSQSGKQDVSPVLEASAEGNSYWEVTRVIKNLAREGQSEGRFFKPVGFETVDRLVQLPDDRIVAVSFGETGCRLDYKVLSFS